ncbi:MAG: aminopeptidase P family protein [Balneolaceae bacterium]
MFSPSTYRSRREHLKQEVGSGLVLLMGNKQVGMNFPHNWYTFRQDSTFLYYTGLNQPGMTLLIDLDEGTETLYGTDPTIDDIVWTGPVPSLDELAASAGIGQAREASALDTTLKNTPLERVHLLPTYRDEHRISLLKWFGLNPGEISKHHSDSLIRTIVEQRLVKTDEEAKQMDEAAAISADMHLEAMRVVRPGMYEYELMSRVHATALEQNGDIAYPIILTVNGQILHNHYYGNRIGDEDVVLVDAGAQTSMGYAGDLTRTFPAGTAFTPRQRDLYNIVLHSFESAVFRTKPGVLFRDLHYLACEKLVEGLKELKLMQGDPAEAVRAGAHTLFFQAGLGHMMGLDVHDMENLGEDVVGYPGDLQRDTRFGFKSLRLARKLEPGHVVTVEPGLYFIPTLIGLWKEEKKLKEFICYDELEKWTDAGGYRVEDDFIVTGQGYRLLGKPVPKTVEEIETVRREHL